MIVTIPVVLALSIYIKDVSCASFSTVYRQNGREYPIEYVKYDAPSFSYGPQIERLSTAPVNPVVTYSPHYPVSPCGTSCVYPQPVAQVAPSANIVQYTAPNLPVVITPSRSDPSGNYEYSYVVYDEQTGDHKAQREFSDGSVVRGGYSFLQPDGYIREVQYVADHLQGFNAVVKHYVPEAAETKKHEHHEKSESPRVPCHEDKNENIEHEEKGDVHENIHAEPTHGNLNSHTVEETHNSAKLVHLDAHPHEEHGLNEKSVEDAAMLAEPEPIHETQTEHYVAQSQIDSTEGPSHEAYEHKAGPSETAHVEHPENAEIEFSKTESHDEENTALQEQHIAVIEPNIDNTNILIPYSDIIRCTQAVLSGKFSNPRHESPLSYIILNKPCS